MRVEVDGERRFFDVQVCYEESPGGDDVFWRRETPADGLVALLRPDET
jgi:hypothetical protein